MFTAVSLLGVVGWFRKSLLAQIAAGVIAFLGVWKVNNYMVEKKTIKKVVAASKEAGKKRNAKSRKIRSTISPSDARKRLLREFANGN